VPKLTRAFADAHTFQVGLVIGSFVAFLVILLALTQG
jgi:hypothetical protein